MKKLFVILSALFLFTPLTVFADTYPAVLTLDADILGDEIVFSGTMEPNSTAVMCKLYDEHDVQLYMYSVPVNNDEFEGAFKVTETGEYLVTCANYEGGEILASAVTVDEIVPLRYDVTFNANGGKFANNEETVTTTVDAGATVGRPEEPTREGKEFVGWYEDQTTLTPFSFDTAINGTTQLYAKWGDPQVETIVMHTVLIGDGGTYSVNFDPKNVENQGPMAAQINRSSMYAVPVGERVEFDATPAEGYHFKGWYLVREVDPDGDGNMEWEEVELLARETHFEYTPSGTPYIQAKFEENIIVHTVTFETNCEIHLASIEVEDDDIVPVPDVDRPGYTLSGWYEDDTFTNEYDFNRPVHGGLTLYAKWIDNANVKTYTVTDSNGNEISFKDEKGHTFQFEVVDLSLLDDEDLQLLTGGQITKEEYDEALGVLKEAVSDEGTFVAIYEIIVVNEDDHEKEKGPFQIKLAKTKEMEKYNSFKLLYVDTDNNFNVEEVIELSDDGNGFLVGTLEHLSSYVLVGNNVSSNNPQTLDNIYVWVIMLLVSFAGLTISCLSARKTSKKK